MSRDNALTAGAAAILIAFPYALRLPLLKARGFNPDEFEHLHAAWCVSRGLLPYRDFFEHHTPWFYFLTAPLFWLFDTDTEVTAAHDLIFWARRTMWLLTGLILALTFVLGALWRGRREAWVGTLFLSSTVMFFGKTLEFRPDVPAAALWLTALVSALRASQVQASAPSRASWLLVGGGAFLGAGILFTQKLLFAVPGFALALVGSRGAPHGSSLWRRLLWPLAGLIAPFALTAAYFATRGALGELIEYNVLLNARWKARVGPRGLIEELAVQNPFLLVLGLLGLIRALRTAFRRGSFLPADLILGSSTLGLLAGLFLIPVVTRQYALMFLPTLSLLAGAALVDLLDEPAVLKERGRARDALLALVLIAVSVGPLRQMAGSFRRGNTADLENIRYVVRNTAPTETVLDGFSGLGVFRSHAFFYFFLHDEIRDMLGEDERARLLADLRSGRVAPKLVLLDSDLRSFSPEVTAFLEANYAPVGREPVRARLYDNGQGRWVDEGVRRLGGPAGPPLHEPHLLVGEGWHQPEAEGGVAFRRSRGRRSQLLVPVRTLGAFLATFRARQEYAAEPVELELSVNGRRAGSQALWPGWRDYGFSIPGPWLKPGFNDFVLAYSATPRGKDPDYHGPDAVVAVESLRLERR